MQGRAYGEVLQPKRCLAYKEREIDGTGFWSGGIQPSGSRDALLLYMSGTRPPSPATPWDHLASKAPKHISVFLARDRVAVFFLAFLVLATVVLPMVTFSRVGQFAVSGVFALTLICGALATIQQRFVVCLVIGLTLSTVAVDLSAGIGPSVHLTTLDTALKLLCLTILLFVTLKRTLRPGRVTVFRVIGAIAGYLLIGFTWAFAYQLIVQEIPDAIYFEPGTAEAAGQPGHLIYFSFITLTTVGYGDAHPVHPAARSLAVAEALVGQLYLATLIASLVGMASLARSEIEGSDDLNSSLHL